MLDGETELAPIRISPRTLTSLRSETFLGSSLLMTGVLAVNPPKDGAVGDDDSGPADSLKFFGPYKLIGS